MPASHAEWRRRRPFWGAAVALFLSGAPGGDLLAQGVPEQTPGSLKPFVLQPPTRLEPPAAPAAAPAGSAQPQTAPPDNPVTSPETFVRIGSLDDVQPDSAGTLSEAEGGFPTSLWRGTPRPVVEKLLASLPVETASVAARQLLRRLLLSAAEVPSGESKVSLLALRADLLARMGEGEALAGLLEIARAPSRGENLARIELDAHLANFNMERACQAAASAQNVAADAYWQQTLVFCQALAKRQDQAALGVALLRERNLGNPVFFDLMDDLNGLGEAKLDNVTDTSALTLAMVRAAQATLPAGLMKSSKPPLARFVALNPGVDEKTRLAAAERAEAMGVLSSASLRAIYAKVAFTKEQLAKPISAAEADGGATGRALLYRTAADQSVAAARAEALSQALQNAQKNGLYPTMARAVAPLVAALPPGPELAWFAPEAARALLVGGTSEGVGAWLALARTGALTDVEKQKRLFMLLPLARLAGVEEAKTWDPELAAWRRIVADTENGNDQAILMQALLEALRDPVFEGSWVGLLQQAGHAPVMLPAAPIWLRLAPASASGRLGEAVALSLIVLGNGGSEEASPIVMRAVLEALLRVGEEKAARALAVEAAVAAGL